MKVLDLFCGAGGLSYGFNKNGFRVTGADISKNAEAAYTSNKIGKFINADLSNEILTDGFDIIVGGPPCKPWSTVNLIKREKNHEDYSLVSRFFKHVEANMPDVFLFENVPAVAKDKSLNFYLKKLSSSKFNYSINKNFIYYKNHGAPTRRKRFIAIGFRKGNSNQFFELLSKSQVKKYATVSDAIRYLEHVNLGEKRDHEWPNLKTSDRYKAYYKTGKFGWYVLNWNEQAPSFGNIMKTYILHPNSFNGGITRAISVREAMLLMGFPRSYHFPLKQGLGARYQMVADSVSPRFSNAAAKIIKQIQTT
jgi:DNA (cytosine-5)-methyltransferase 1